ncbi:hypothetical protein QVD17_04905 [Tagetes erecta]|uniref:Uncharacterized protein n=1 Tax=Tagetes erecta TaxID=13708 RepID=A0AAD8LKF6_TARER|nr:hypothetical protein QVD17_04905 [Tagetes erecta]
MLTFLNNYLHFSAQCSSSSSVHFIVISIFIAQCSSSSSAASSSTIIKHSRQNLHLRRLPVWLFVFFGYFIFAFLRSFLLQVIKFVSLQRDCKEFSQYLTYKIEGSILQLKRKANSIEEVELVLKILNNGSDFLDISSEIHSKKLTFNEDSKLRLWRTPSLEKIISHNRMNIFHRRPVQFLTHQMSQTVHMLEIGMADGFLLSISITFICILLILQIKG